MIRFGGLSPKPPVYLVSEFAGFPWCRGGARDGELRSEVAFLR